MIWQISILIVPSTYEPTNLMGDLKNKSKSDINSCSIQLLDHDPRLIFMLLYKTILFSGNETRVFITNTDLLE